MNPELFAKHLVNLVRAASFAGGDPVARALHTQENKTLTDAYAGSLPEEQGSFFNPEISVSPSKGARTRRRGKKRGVKIIRFSTSSADTAASAAAAAAGGGGDDAAGGGTSAAVGAGAAAAGAASGGAAAVFTKTACGRSGAEADGQAPKSALSAIMAVEEVARARRAAAEGKASSLRVFVAFSDAPKEPVAVKVTMGSTMEAIVLATIEAYNADPGRSPKLEPQAARYLLRLTDDDQGTPDMDLPALERKQTLRSIGCTDFVLCKDPSAKSLLSARISNQDDRRRSLVFAASDRAGDGELCFTVTLPDKSSTAAIVRDDLTVAEFIKKVCTKRAISTDAVEAFLPGISVPVNRALVLKDLGTTDLTLERTAGASASSSARDSIMLADDDSNFNHMFNQFTAIIYKEYEVTKINKAGKRQPRVLGIDDKRITNKIPESEQKKKGLMSRFGKKHPKRPFRNVDEIINIVHHDAADGKAFSIYFRGDEHTDYEAVSRSQAAEIVAKITYLVGMAEASPVS